MKPITHIIASISLGGILWFFTKSIPTGILCFASGIFVDSDHVIEYIIHYGWKGLEFEKIYEACEQTGQKKGDHKFKKLYIIFHTIEIVLLFWLATIYTKNMYLFAFTVGYSAHLILDFTGNKLRLLSYFMFWRVINKFDSDKLIRSEDGDI